MTLPSYSSRKCRTRSFRFTLIAALFAQSVISAAAQTAPVAAYNFDDGSGPTTRDFSIYNNTGTLTGPSWTTGKFAGGLNFDGFSWVTINDSLSLDISNAMTLEAWIFPTAATGN